MHTELVGFTAADGFPLDGALHRPLAPRAGTRALLVVHGKTMNFYTCAGRILPPHVTALGWTCFAMNRRGHDLGGVRNGRASYGGANERFDDSRHDIAGALDELRRRGCTSVVLLGHSFGGICAAAYAAEHPAEVAALALSSAARGGPDYLAQCSRAGLLAGDRHEAIDREARRLVAEGRGEQMIALPGWWYAITAASWVDLSANVPLVVDVARRYGGSILALRGSEEPREQYPAEAIAEACGPRATLAVVPGADHFYDGAEAAFAAAVCQWLRGLPA